MLMRDGWCAVHVLLVYSIGVHCGCVAEDDVQYISGVGLCCTEGMTPICRTSIDVDKAEC